MARRTTSAKDISKEFKRKSAENFTLEQRKDWGYTNQFRRMMQRRKERDADL